MSESKIKYIIVFGVAPFVREQLIEDLKSSPFAFMFDETTTTQLKKQYGIENHFFAFGNALQWGFKYLLHIGMDGPNVNKCLHWKLEDELLNLHGKKKF